MNKTILSSLIALLVFTSTSWATTSERIILQKPFQLREGKKASYYLKTAKSLKKKKDMVNSISNALHAKTIGNKRQKKKAKKFLDANFSKTISDTETKMETLEKEILNYAGENSALQANTLFCLYSDMMLMKKLSEAEGGSYAVADYKDELENATKWKEVYFKQTADIYFQKAIEKEALAKSRLDFLSLARSMARALAYDQREEIQNKYKDYRAKAICRLGIAPVKDLSGHSAASTTGMRDLLEKEIRILLDNKKGVHYPYFELIPNNKSLLPDATNVKLIVSVENFSFDKGKREIEKDEKSKSINIGSKDNPKKIVVTATLSTHTIWAKVTMDTKYSLIDEETGEVLASDIFATVNDWSYQWGRASGDKRALSKHDKEFVKKESGVYVEESYLIKGVIPLAMRKASGKVKEFALKEGR